MTFLRQPRLLLLATSTMPVSNCWSKLFEPVRFFKHHLPIFWSNSSVVAVGKTTSPLAWDSRVGTPSFRPLIWCEMLVKSASNARLVAGAGRESVGVLATVTSTWGTEGPPASPGAGNEIFWCRTFYCYFSYLRTLLIFSGSQQRTVGWRWRAGEPRWQPGPSV